MRGFDFVLLGLQQFLLSISQNVGQFGAVAPVHQSQELKLVKRQNQCVNASTTNYFGQTFIVVCGIEFTYPNQVAAQITFTPTYEQCVLACVEFDSTVACVGV